MTPGACLFVHFLISVQSAVHGWFTTVFSFLMIFTFHITNTCALIKHHQKGIFNLDMITYMVGLSI